MSEEKSLDTFNDEQTGVVDQSENYADFEMTESVDSQPEVVEQEVGTESDDTEQPKVQSREDNHAAKAARLKAEREAKAMVERAKQEARDEINRLMRTSGAKNPYTEKPFESFDEFMDYGKKVSEAELQERADAEGKSIEEIRQEEEDKAYIQKKRQEDSEKENSQRAKEEEQAHINDDLNDFVEQYPNVDVSNLITNQNFLKFCGSRLGKEPLSGLYSDYSELVRDAEEVGKVKDTRGRRSTGSGESSGAVTLTASQKRDLDAWNRAFPEMEMKPSEYLKR